MRKESFHGKFWVYGWTITHAIATATRGALPHAATALLVICDGQVYLFDKAQVHFCDSEQCAGRSGKEPGNKMSLLHLSSDPGPWHIRSLGGRWNRAIHSFFTRITQEAYHARKGGRQSTYNRPAVRRVLHQRSLFLLNVLGGLLRDGTSLFSHSSACYTICRFSSNKMIALSLLIMLEIVITYV